MNWKKILKIFGFSILFLVLIGAIGVGYLYYESKGKYAVNENKYPNYIGKINPKNASYTEGFALCDSNRKPYGFYSSAAPKIYKKSRLAFKRMVKNNFRNDDYNDSGYLNLRFNINCKGETGNLIVTELNSDLEKAQLNEQLVNQLVNLSLKEENWQIIRDTDINYYMYLLFKIEHGKITEILP